MDTTKNLTLRIEGTILVDSNDDGAPLPHAVIRTPAEEWAALSEDEAHAARIVECVNACTGATGDEITALRNGPKFLAVYIGCNNDTNGNPRRGWYVSRLDGRPMLAEVPPNGRNAGKDAAYTCWVEEGYGGRSALDHAINEATGDVKGEHIRDYLDRVRALVRETGRIEVTPGEYRSARKLPRVGGAE